MTPDEEIDFQASTLMKRGIALLADTRPGAGAEALANFDRALDLRRRLPLDDPRFRYGLAACWLSRADALGRSDGTEERGAALRAYDEAIELLRGLPLDADPRYRRRLAIAHQNRGRALLGRGEEQGGDATEAFAAAIALLEDDRASRIDDRQYLLAAVWTNLAGARLADGAPGPTALARDAAARAIPLVADLERTNADAADVGLRARHILCLALARRLEGADTPTFAEVHGATNAVDDGLALVNDWERRGVARFRQIRADLFAFGTLIYRMYQPQLLDGFIRAHRR